MKAWGRYKNAHVALQLYQNTNVQLLEASVCIIVYLNALFLMDKLHSADKYDNNHY